MILESMDVVRQHPIRRSKKQKNSFCNDILAYATKLGYSATVEQHKKNVHNIIIGDPKTADYLITAHYDTPAVSLLPNFLAPTNLIVYVLYQIVLILFYFAIAFLVSLLVAVITRDENYTFLAWYVAYMALILLLRYGPSNKNNYNDNSSGVITVLETARFMPEAQRNRVCFVLFDLEERGMVGSSAYRKVYKAETDKQIVINLDCVGDGDEMLIFPTKKLKKHEKVMCIFRNAQDHIKGKKMALVEKGFFAYPSDQKSFPNAVSIAAFRRNKLVGPYHGRIHTCRDTVLDETNINTLRTVLIWLTGSAVN